MVKFQDPNVILQEMRAVMELSHVFGGIFLWEFFTTLDFEWSVIRGNRPYRWTIWIYSLTRIATLVAIILDFVGLHLLTPINCQLEVTFDFMFSYLALACASLLLMLRVVAIWKRNKIILALAITVWTTNVAFLIQGVVRVHSVWITNSEERCLLTNSNAVKLNAIAMLATDTILFLMMLTGLLHLRVQGWGMLGLGNLLWKQGVIWFLLAAVAEVPPTVFLVLNLNDALNQMFQIPALIVLSIGATRMYRSLINFSSDMYGLLT
ncbi:hypothetical protein BGW80DRAFT_230996 [Lactifluus volemus]|nr:hypothetical protein BGW80DRAFT_230996 [Lactifluus volemus]